MPTTPRGATELTASQAVPETTVNQQVRHTESGACHFPVADKDLTAPPGSCADGANYIIAATATGAWTGKEKQVATAVGTNAANGWLYHVPVEGFTAYLQDENARYLYDGSAWGVDTGGITLDYNLGLFFTSTPTASEVLALHIAAVAFTLPANFASPNSKGVIGTNPTASFAIDVQRQVNATGAFSTIGTITISTGGAFTFATASGTAKAIAVNDVLKFVAPGTADATAANAAITILGSR